MSRRRWYIYFSYAVLCRYELGQAEYITKLPKGKHSTKGFGKTEPDPNKVHMTLDAVKVPYGKGVNAKLGDRETALQYNEYPYLLCVFRALRFSVVFPDLCLDTLCMMWLKSTSNTYSSANLILYDSLCSCLRTSPEPTCVLVCKVGGFYFYYLLYYFLYGRIQIM